MTKAKIQQIEELVTKDLSNGRHVQKKIKDRVSNMGETPDSVVEKIKVQRKKRSIVQEIE